jgi:hypothetical protein
VIAKPVVKNKFWIVKNGDLKVGEVERDKAGFSVRLGEQSVKFKTIGMIRDRLGVEFEPPIAESKSEINAVSGYPTDTVPYEPVYDIKRKLPLYVKEPTSKCWHAAGWYKISQNNKGAEWVLCPKLIILQRYPYLGPFREKGA